MVKQIERVGSRKCETGNHGWSRRCRMEHSTIELYSKYSGNSIHYSKIPDATGKRLLKSMRMTSPPAMGHPSVFHTYRVSLEPDTNIMTTTVHCHFSSFSFLLTSLLILSSVSWSPSWERRTIHFPPNQDSASIHRHFMKLALDQASIAAKVGEVPIGAILVHEDQRNDSTTTYRILARAGNRVETNFDASAHAELQVLRRGAKRQKNWRLLNTTLYSTLEPCPMCLAACQAFRLPTLVYGAPDLRLGAVETHLRLLDFKHPYHNVSTVIKGVREDESAGMLRHFFKRRRREGGRRRTQSM